MRTFLLSLGIAIVLATLSGVLMGLTDSREAPFTAFMLGLPMYLVGTWLILAALPDYLLKCRR